MILLEEDASFRLRREFSLSEADEEVLALLYLPIIKADGYALYRAFYDYAPIQKALGYFSTDNFLKLTGFAKADFLFYRSRLEAIGLLETYRKEENGKVSYLYRILPPASPKKFFNDVLLRALLVEEVGEKRYFLLVSHFKVLGASLEEGYVNISTPFKEVYSPNVTDDSIALKPILEDLEDKNYKGQNDFDEKEFLSLLSSMGANTERLNSYLDSIAKEAALYDVPTKDMAKIVAADLDSDGTFYEKKFISDVRKYRKFTPAPKTSSEGVSGASDSAVAKLLNGFQSLTPQEYLSMMYRAKPSAFMLKEIEHLAHDLSLTNPVINVVLDYCLKKTKMEFNTTFIDKVAYTVSGQNIGDAYSALVYLSSRDFEVGRKTAAKTTRKKKAEPAKKENEVNEEDIADLVKDIDI